MGKPNKTLYLRSTFPVKCWSEIVFKVIKPTIDKRPWDNDLMVVIIICIPRLTHWKLGPKLSYANEF